MNRKIIQVLLLSTKILSDVCYTEPSHFVLDALAHGHWAHTEGNYRDVKSSAVVNAIVSQRDFNASKVRTKYEWVSSGERVALGNISYGNLRCPLEEYVHACGSGLGSHNENFDWHIAGLKEWDRSGKGDKIGIEKRFPTWRKTWLMHDGIESWKYRRWEPSNCFMPYFDGAALVDALRGGRELKMIGDSTMRELFIATGCMIPREYILDYQIKWDIKHGPRYRLLSGSQVKLKNGGKIWYSDGRMNTSPFGRGNRRDILIQHADLHQQGRIRSIVKKYADNIIQAFESDSDLGIIESQKKLSFREALNRSPWQIYFQKSVQHFLKANDHTANSLHSCNVNGEYTKVGLEKFHTCRLCSHYDEGMQEQEARLSGFIPVISNHVLLNVGAAHPTTFYTDCTHFCQPGPQDALVTSMAAIIIHYHNATNFYDQVTMSPFWQDRRREQKEKESTTRH